MGHPLAIFYTLCTGAEEQFLPRGGPILKNPFFSDFSKNLLNKSQILGVPPPLPIYKPAHIPDS